MRSKQRLKKLHKIKVKQRKTVFKQLMGALDVAFSSAHFADSAMIGANKLAKGNDALAKEIFADATKISPVTKEGIELRQKANEEQKTCSQFKKVV